MEENEYNVFQQQPLSDADSANDNDDAGDSSSDENEPNYTKGKRLPRFRYQTVDASSDSDSNDKSSSRQRKQQSRKDEQIYGVFGENDDDGGFKPTRKAQSTAGNKAAPMFVKSQVDPVQNDLIHKSPGESVSVLLTQSTKGDDDNQSKDIISELEMKKLENETDDKFRILLNAGRSKRPTDEPNEKHDHESSLRASKYSVTTSMKENQAHPIFKKDPNLGKWEKHTKGIGMKLLSQMGYKGSGALGKRKEEAHASSKFDPIEVKVRPANLGLGFGNFQEATSLKLSRKNEGKISEKDDRNKPSTKNRTYQGKSMLPSNADIMSEKSWKKGSSYERKKKRKIIHYTDLLEGHKGSSMAIIDMRGPQSSLTPNGEMEVIKEIPLGEELLYNVSMQLRIYETKILSAKHSAATIDLKVSSLKSEIESFANTRKQIEDRIRKLRSVQESLDHIGTLLSRSGSMCGPDVVLTLKEGLLKIFELGRGFTTEELNSLQFFTSMVPTLLEPLTRAQLDRWNPLESDIETSKEIVKIVLLLHDDLKSEFSGTESLFNESNQLTKLRIRLLMDYLLPKIVSELESPRWNAVINVEPALQLFEIIQEAVSQLSELPGGAKSSIVDEDDSNAVFLGQMDLESNVMNELPRLVNSAIVHNVVYPKLVAMLGHWKPKITRQSQSDAIEITLKDRPDLWILPWIPYLVDDENLTTLLVADCKRKVKASLSYLQKKIQSGARSDESTISELEFFDAAIALLRPWRGVFKQESIHSMVSESISPRSSRYISSRISVDTVFGRKGHRFQWSDTIYIFRMHSLNLITDIEFLSIVESDLLTSWVCCVHQWLCTGLEKMNSQELAENYIEWKHQILQARPIIHLGYKERHPSISLLQQDRRICSCFYAVLLMIQAAETNNTSALEDLRPPDNMSLRVVVSNRKLDAKRLASDDLIRMNASGRVNGYDKGEIEARVRLSHGNSSTMPVFRDVVAEFARERDILFQPKMSQGQNASKDGNQIFLFGSIPVYLSGTIVFALKEGQWGGISLDELAARAQSPKA